MDATEKLLLTREIDALVRALEEERFRHVAGLTTEPALTAIFGDHSRAAHRDTVAALRADGDEALARRVAALRAERAAASSEGSWRAAESRASGQGPEGPIALGDAEIAVLRERDRGRRLAFAAAVAEAAAGASRAREAAAEERARARAESGLVPDWEQVLEADDLLDATEDAYTDVLEWLARREIGVAPAPRGDLSRADLLYVTELPRYEGLFPPGMLAIVLEKLLGPWRLAGRVRIDEASRPGQWPGAHAMGAQVSLRRRGGAGDYADLFAAVGAALAAAETPPHERESALPATAGALLSGLLLDAKFLTWTLQVERSRASDLVRGVALRTLFRLRARAAALRVATEVERGLSGAAFRNAHREALSIAARATWPDGLAARDADAASHAAALRGAAIAARLRRELVERLDEDWWRNPRSAEALADLLAGRWLPSGERDPRFVEAGKALVARLGGGI